MNTKYAIYDNKEKKFTGLVYKSFLTADRKVNKLESQYGSCKYSIKRIEE